MQLDVMAVDGSESIENGGLTLQNEIHLNEIPVPKEPQKSSNEILSELFSAFNAEPPVLPDIVIHRRTDSPRSSDGSEKHSKKHGKKHKKKHKKEKKRKRSSSRDSGTADEHKAKRHKTSKKKRKSKTKNYESESDSSETLSNSKQKKKKHKKSDSDSDRGSCEKKYKHKRKKSRKNSPEYVKNKGDYDNNKINGDIQEVIDTAPGKIIVDNTFKNLSEVKTEENIKVIKEESKNVLTCDISKTIDKVFESIPLIVKQEKSNTESKNDNNRLACNDEHVNNNSIDKSSLSEEKHEKTSDKVLLGSEPENIPLPVADVFVEDLLDSGVKKEQLKLVPDKPKTSTGKITIKNLKYSTVYEETVRQVEEQAKLKAEKYEEGELSDSTSEHPPSSSPSPEPSSGSVVESPDEVKHPNSSRSRHSHHRHHHHHHHRKSRKDDDRAQSSEKHVEARRSRYSSAHSHNRDRSRSSHRSKHRESKGEKSRRRSRDKDRERSRSRHRDYSRDRYKYHHRHSRSWRSRTRSQSREKGSSGVLEEGIDKQKLLEIARKNALNMLKVPSGGTDPAKVAITAGGKTVDELTDFCKLLSKKDADGHESISSNTSESSDSDTEKPFHHPFQIKDRPSNIVMNIRNSVPLPVKTMQEKTAEQSRQLRMLFPVSSGQQHRKTENEWVPVSPKKEEPVSTLPVAVVKPAIKPTPAPVQNVFQQPPNVQNIDIGTLVAQRLAAMRKLQENPNDVEALNEMYRAQREMQAWAESKQQPGQFTGSTGAKVLSQAELSSGVQAWARRDQLQSAAPVSGGLGMALLQKMGWRPGEGLGKNKEGTLQPLMLEVKMDKKGLVAQEELPCRPPNVTTRGAVKHYEGKHPASMLNEYCSRHRIGPPYFELCFEGGPDHKKHFLFKVKVNGVEYKPTVGSPSKKQARAEAAAMCLRALGVLPSN